MTDHENKLGRRVAQSGRLLLYDTSSHTRSEAVLRKDAELEAEELHYVLFAPAATCLAENVSGTRMHFIRLGFSISVPEHYKIEWLRYEVVFGFPAPCAEVEVSDAHPRIVHSSLEGVQALPNTPLYLAASGTQTSATEQSVRVLGFFPATNIVCWDFIPVDGKSLAGCESLSVRLQERKGALVSVTQVLYMHTFAPDTGKLMFQCRSAKINVLGGGNADEDHPSSFGHEK